MSSGDIHEENFRVSFDIPEKVKEMTKDYKKSLDAVNKAIQRAQMSEALKEQLATWAEPPKVSEVTGTVLSSWSDNTNPQRGWHTWTSDRVEVDKGLTAAEIQRAMQSLRGMGTSAQEAAERMKRLTRQLRENGHKSFCLYQDNSHDYACTCQPPTIWGRPLMWHCDCCGRPRSPMKWGLCDLCHGHQYDPVSKAQADHEAVIGLD